MRVCAYILLHTFLCLPFFNALQRSIIRFFVVAANKENVWGHTQQLTKSSLTNTSLRFNTHTHAYSPSTKPPPLGTTHPSYGCRPQSAKPACTYKPMQVLVLCCAMYVLSPLVAATVAPLLSGTQLACTPLFAFALMRALISFTLFSSPFCLPKIK